MQFWLRRVAPFGHAALTRLAFNAANVQLGRGLQADGVPRLLVDDSARVAIGDDVVLRSDVEIRAHGTAELRVEDDVRIDRGVRLLAANQARVTLAKGCRVGLYSVLNGGDSITIGENSLISGFVYLQTSMHRYKARKISIRDQGYDHGPVVIGSGCWLAAHVVVMPGVTVGDGAIVGSNAVVTKDVAPGAIVAGVPAKAIGQRGELERTR